MPCLSLAHAALSLPPGCHRSRHAAAPPLVPTLPRSRDKASFKSYESTSAQAGGRSGAITSGIPVAEMSDAYVKVRPHAARAVHAVHAAHAVCDVPVLVRTELAALLWSKLACVAAPNPPRLAPRPVLAGHRGADGRAARLLRLHRPHRPRPHQGERAVVGGACGGLSGRWWRLVRTACSSRRLVTPARLPSLPATHSLLLPCFPACVFPPPL